MTSATATSTSAAASSTCGATLYDIPVQDASCAIPYGGNHTDIMSKCCKSADVVAYRDNCGLYCLAVDQTVNDLIHCLEDNGAGYSNVFCRGNTTASATNTAGDSVPTTAGASVVASAGSTGSATKSGSSATGSSSGSAGVRVVPEFGGVRGVLIGGLLFSAALFGAWQV